jgi:hypothetical protein
MRWTEEQLQAWLVTDVLRRNPPGAPSTKSTKSARPKYGNRKVLDADGISHDSRKEYSRWCELQLRERAGEISQLHRQPVFDLIVNGVLVCKYVADASYVESATGERIVEDTKSAATRKNRAYRIKVKLLRACHGLQVREV